MDDGVSSNAGFKSETQGPAQRQDTEWSVHGQNQTQSTHAFSNITYKACNEILKLDFICLLALN